MSESVQALPQFVDSQAISQQGRNVRPTFREWALHSFLFFITLVTTTIAGVVIEASGIDAPSPRLLTVLDYLLYLPKSYLQLLVTLLSFVLLNPHSLTQGLIFS